MKPHVTKTIAEYWVVPLGRAVGSSRASRVLAQPLFVALSFPVPCTCPHQRDRWPAASRASRLVSWHPQRKSRERGAYAHASYIYIYIYIYINYYVTLISVYRTHMGLYNGTLNFDCEQTRETINCITRKLWLPQLLVVETFLMLLTSHTSQWPSGFQSVILGRGSDVKLSAFRGFLVKSVDIPPLRQSKRCDILRTTMQQDRLNYLMLMHMHKDRTDSIDLNAVSNEFVGESRYWSGIFAKY